MHSSSDSVTRPLETLSLSHTHMHADKHIHRACFVEEWSHQCKALLSHNDISRLHTHTKTCSDNLQTELSYSSLQQAMEICHVFPLCPFTQNSMQLPLCFRSILLATFYRFPARKYRSFHLTFHSFWKEFLFHFSLLFRPLDSHPSPYLARLGQLFTFLS